MSIGAKGISVCLSIPLHPNFLYATSNGPVEAAHLHEPSLSDSVMIPQSFALAHFYYLKSYRMDAKDDQYIH